MMLRVAPFVLAGALLAWHPAVGGAQVSCEANAPTSAPACSHDHVVIATVAPILRLDLSTLTTAMLSPAQPQFDSARVATSLDQLPLTTGPTIGVRANRPWALKMMAASPEFSFDPDPVYQITRASGKPASDLAWSLSALQGFVPLGATAAADVASSAAGGSFTEHVVYFRTRWVYSLDVPGHYGLHITFTLTGS
ncbi:MAG: hypothetical protein H0X64_01920 [Gemmatimonadaceae bacterium]|nr:hypothetical protein [Gemmatimonadaceae bacterium]